MSALSTAAWLSQQVYKAFDLELKADLVTGGFEVLKFFEIENVSCLLCKGLQSKDNWLVFRGTQDPRDWIDNLSLVPEELRGDSEHGSVHGGFLDHIETVWPEVVKFLDESNEKVNYCAGHSLGGAAACVAGYRLSCYGVYTFGAPRIGDKQFAKKLEEKTFEALRVSRCLDVVSRVPISTLSWGFHHAGQHVYIDRKEQCRRNPGRAAVTFDRLAAARLNPVRWSTLAVAHHSIDDYTKLMEGSNG